MADEFRYLDILLIVMRLRYIFESLKRTLKMKMNFLTNEERLFRDRGKYQPLSEEAFEFIQWLLLLVSCERRVNYLDFEFF